MSYTITYSADLLRNFLQDDVVAPESKFQALQGTDGASLLFSTGTDGALYAMAELPQTRSGWSRTDISSAILQRDFAGKPGAKVKDFATAQRVSDPSAAIHLSMVITDGHDDALYLSLNNPNTGPDWAQTGPAWAAYPFDDKTVTLKQLVIAGVFISEAADGEYIVADIVRNPGDPQPKIARYYIDPAGKQAWQQHDVSIDLAASGYVSCLGRASDEDIDGLYTSGHVSGAPQLMYQPLYNEFGSGPAAASRFKLPGGLTADNIAAARNADDTSDLYITAGGGLYYLGNRSQQDNATATHLFDNALFTGVTSLFAAAIPSGGAVVWGLNASNQVFYTTCATSNPATGVWSRPLPIVTGAEQVSPYLDRASDANTFFCHTGIGKLTKNVKSPGTTMWSPREITLPPPQNTAPARNFSSYTTTIRITDENGTPVEGAEVTVQAVNHTRAYINYLYYVLGSAAATVLTDADGTVTIIEPSDGLTGTRLAIQVGEAEVEINPMDTAFRTAASLTTADLLMGAVITNPVDGSQTPLVPSGTPADSLQAAADGNGQLGVAYDNQQSVGMFEGARASRAARAKAAHAKRVHGAAHAPAVELPGGVFSFLVEAGDLFLSLTEQIGKTIAQVVYDEAAGLYNFVAQIGDDFYHCVLDCVESIVTGAWHLLTMIIDEIENIIKFLEFLFEWQDITRTKNVIATMLKVSLEYQLNQFSTVRPQFDKAMDDLHQEIAGWAGLDWAGLGEAGQSTPNDSAGQAPQQTSPSSLVTHHYQNNAQNASQAVPDPETDSDDPMAAVLAAIASEGDTLGEAISQVLTLAGELPTMSIDEALNRFAGILGETVVDSARNVGDALLEVLTEVGTALLKIFDAKIHIPVVSDILEFFGIPEFSFLDVAAWLTAVPATILFKLVTHQPPFPAGAQTDSLISAPDFPTLLELVTSQPQLLAATAGGSHTELEKGIHCGGHFAAALGSFGQGILGFLEAAEPPGNRFAKLSGLCALFGGASGGVASWATSKLVPGNAVQTPSMINLSDILLIFRIALKAYAMATTPPPFGGATRCGGMLITNYRGLYAVYDAILGILSLGVTICHFTELAGTPADADMAIAICDEISNMTGVAARVCYAFAVNAPDPDSAALPILAMTTCNFLIEEVQMATAMLIF